MRKARLRSLFLVAAGLVAVASVCSAASQADAKSQATEPRSESLVYRWTLEGVSGAILKLFRVLPTSGDAGLTLDVNGGRLTLEFTATSPKAKPDEFWRYTSRVELPAWRTLAVRERVKYGKKDREKNFDLRNLEVLDVLSGLQFLRYQNRGDTERRTIWSDGKMYPVLVTSGGVEWREVGDRRDQKIAVRRLEIRGVREPRQKRWNASAEVWLTADGTARPVEMLYRQSLGRLRLSLVRVEPEP